MLASSNKISQSTVVPVEAFILVGGRSSRLGRDKALVEFGGETLAGRAVSNIRSALSPERITMVAASPGQFAVDAFDGDVPFIFDLYPGLGPLSGIHSALAYARTPWIFVLACDFPFVSQRLIQAMAENISDESGAVVPRQSDGRLQPLCAFYKVEIALPLVEEICLVQRRPPPMHKIVRSFSPLVVDVQSDPTIRSAFTNINDPNDLATAENVLGAVDEQDLT